MMNNSLPTQKAWAKVAGSTWQAKILSKLNLLLLLGTSIQLGLHFWPSSALVYGVRIDYLSPTLYALDLGVVLSLCLSYSLKPKSSNLKALSPLLLLALSNLLFSVVPLQSLIWWSRLLLYSIWASALSGAYLKSQVKWLLLWLALLFALGLLQAYLGHSLQGMLYWLGERRFDLGQPGIALQELFGVKYLRAYSLFSHPNIFAGWSVILVYLITMSSRAKRSVVERSLSYTLGLAIMVATASRAGALTLALIFLFTLKAKSYNLKPQKIIYFILGTLFFVYLLTVRPESVILPRLTLLLTSLRLFFHAPFFGAGALGSLSLYPIVSPTLRFLQPDHFTPTLLLSWLGLVGLVQLMFILFSFKPKSSQLKALLPLLPLLIFDHYLLTSLSGIVIFILFLRFTPLFSGKLKAIT